MKKKTINSVICKKFDSFLKSITDEDVRNLIEANTVITGGCIASMLLKEKVNDYDLYFTNKKTVLAVANYFVAQFNELNNTSHEVVDGEKLEGYEDRSGVTCNMTPDRVKIVVRSAGVASSGDKDTYDFGNEESEEIADVVEQLDDFAAEPIDQFEKEYVPVFLSNNAITLSGKIQIVIRFYGEPGEIHDNYDFVHCTNYWSSRERKVVLNLPAMESLMARELSYIGSKYPVCSVIRTRKFLKRGWTINAGQYLKMQFQISKLDLSNPFVLEDQLTGVDFAFFDGLIQRLKEKQSKEPDFKLDYGYLATIIDKMF